MVSKRVKRPDEFALIGQYFRPLATDPGAFELSDDAAAYRPSRGRDLVLTVDTVAAGVHFHPSDPPDSIARKALRVNLSDLAAKGASAVGYMLALALPHDWSERWVRRFAAGLADDQRRYDVTLLGGDTTRAAGGVTISITAIGEVPTGKMVRRSGARPGDAIFVSGTLGDAALALEIARGKLSASRASTARLLDRYRNPQPRMSLAPVLRRYAHSALDVSDGLVGDLAHVCSASGVGAVIEAARVPLSKDASSLVVAQPQALTTALTGGDDYEILATVGQEKAAAFVDAAGAVGVAVTEIGRVGAAGDSVPVVLDQNGKALRLAQIGHTHF
jgi:thiamine-monophosphate kinase